MTVITLSSSNSHYPVPTLKENKSTLTWIKATLIFLSILFFPLSYVFYKFYESQEQALITKEAITASLQKCPEIDKSKHEKIAAKILNIINKGRKPYQDEDLAVANGEIIVNLGVLGRGASNMAEKSYNIDTGEVIVSHYRSVNNPYPNEELIQNLFEEMEQCNKNQFRMYKKYLKDVPGAAIIYGQAEIEPGKVRTFMEYCPGDMMQGNYTFEQKLEFAKYLLQTLVFLEKKGVVHRDIKPDNIRLDVNGNPKLIDWGLSCHINDKIIIEGNSKDYTAPEYHEHRIISPKGDVFSLSKVLEELFQTAEPSQRDKVIPIIDEMMRRKPEKRMSAQEALTAFRRIKI